MPKRLQEGEREQGEVEGGAQRKLCVGHGGEI